VQHHSIRSHQGGGQGLKLTATFKPQAVLIEINSESMGLSVGNPVARDYVERDPYTGSYMVTPSAEQQTLNTRNLRMTDDVVVEAIPSNYGLITWDGSTLTVS
jgi:hypothetical protein